MSSAPSRVSGVRDIPAVRVDGAEIRARFFVRKSGAREKKELLDAVEVAIVVSLLFRALRMRAEESFAVGLE